jgi:hypothetical protein
MVSVEPSSGPDQEDESLSSPVDGLGEEFSSPRQNVMFEAVTKGTHEPLPSRIQRESCQSVSLHQHLNRGFGIGLYYINAYGMEVRPSPNGDFLANLDTRDILVYSCGSLWTRSVALF